jgi:hypothetical protein
VCAVDGVDEVRPVPCQMAPDISHILSDFTLSRFYRFPLSLSFVLGAFGNVG